MNFLSQIFVNDINHGYRAAILKKISLWLLSFYMAVAAYCYYEKVRRSMCTAIVSYLLKYLPYEFVNSNCPNLMSDAMKASEEIGRFY